MRRLFLIVELTGLLLIGGCRAGIPENLPTSSPQATRTPLPTGSVESGYDVVLDRSSLERIRSEETLTVGILYNYPPFCYLADDGEIKGFEVDVLTAIAEYWGVKVEFVQVTHQTGRTLLYEGDIDVLAGAMPHTRDLEAEFDFTDSYFNSGIYAVAHDDVTASSLTALNGLRVGYYDQTAKNAFNIAADRNGITAALSEFPDRESATEALLGNSDTGITRSIDVVIGPREQMMLSVSASRDLELMAEPISVVSYAFMTMQGDVALRNLMDLSLQHLAREGMLGQFFTAHFYGLASDIYPVYPGTPKYSYNDFPTDLLASESVIDRIARGEAIRVAGLSLAEEPELFDSQPILDGFNRAIIDEMAGRWGVPVIELPDSVGQAGLDLLRAGEADIVVNVQRDVSLIGDYGLTDPYYDVGLRIVKQSSVALWGIGDLEFKPSLAAPPVEMSTSLIRDNNVFPSIETADTFEQAYETLRLYTVWAVVGDEYSIFLMSQADDDIELVGERYRPRNRAMALPVLDSQFQTLVEYTIQDMMLDGTVEEISNLYFGPYIPEGEEITAFQPLETWPGISTSLGVGGY